LNLHTSSSLEMSDSGVQRCANFFPGYSTASTQDVRGKALACC